MSIDSPSSYDFRLLGKILFYALILPALFYYIWQVLKALFGLLVEVFSSSEERKPLVNHSPNSDEDKLFLRAEFNQSERSVSRTDEYDVSSQFGDDLLTKNVSEIKQVFSDKIKVDSNAIKTLEFFRKKSPVTFLPGDAEPADINTACYLKIIAFTGAEKNTYYFKYISGRSNSKENIGTEDTFGEVKQKISQRVKGESDTTIRLFYAGKDLSSNLNNNNKFAQLIDFKEPHVYQMTFQNAWKAGYSKEESEERVMKITF